MKLTPEQIDQLYAFTRQHYVEYYDLQTELVDHLANAIEQQWEENPSMSFDDALQTEFKKFGIFGFTELVEKREGALNKKYKQIVHQHLRDFFKLPKIIGTVLSVVLVFYLLKQFRSVNFMIPVIVTTLMGIYFFGLSILMWSAKRQVKKTGKKWMLHQVIFGFKSISGFCFGSMYLLAHFDGVYYSDWVYWLSSFVCVLLLLIGYIVLILIPSKAEQYLKETYPEYEISK